MKRRTDRCPRRSKGIVGGIVICLATVVASVSGHTVTRVVDGDTILVAAIGTVRLIGVDTPETVDPRRPVQAYGAEAAAFLRGLLTNRTVRLEYDEPRRDRYDRVLAYVYLDDGTFVNRKIIRQGYGHASMEFPFRLMDDFRAAQREAMEGKRGVWADYQPSALELLPRCQALTQARHAGQQSVLLAASTRESAVTP